jgi:hypothetical protein
VATEGGENNFSLEPINVEIVRVVDSEGYEHFQEFPPLSADPKELGQRLFRDVPILSKLIQKFGLSDWRALSYLYFATEKQPDPEAIQAISDARRFIKTLRDILEWATLTKLSFESSRPVFLRIRDGLLRTKFIKKRLFPKLAELFKHAYDERGAMIVGVAKRSKALNYLSLALALGGVFDRRAPCFAEVPRELEEEAYTGPTRGWRGSALADYMWPSW